MTIFFDECWPLSSNKYVMIVRGGDVSADSFLMNAGRFHQKTYVMIDEKFCDV